ncbi:unnamed protein product [Ceratitis capitata]|uniref:(Mediterranean fruit fly) hypothetical protein n=1 Tax=Ceratitis capitata TaxID=7213 RepID=A0A811UTD0_CERCA|nr:unnamed protein product [Ceratitis capitata]
MMRVRLVILKVVEATALRAAPTSPTAVERQYNGQWRLLSPIVELIVRIVRQLSTTNTALRFTAAANTLPTHQIKRRAQADAESESELEQQAKNQLTHRQYSSLVRTGRRHQTHSPVVSALCRVTKE